MSVIQINYNGKVFNDFKSFEREVAKKEKNKRGDINV